MHRYRKHRYCHDRATKTDKRTIGYAKEGAEFTPGVSNDRMRMKAISTAARALVHFWVTEPELNSSTGPTPGVSESMQSR